MRVRIQNELLLINIITVLLIIVITFFPSNALRIVLGLPLVLFFPGYTLVAALFPRKDQLDGIERVALSFGLSVAVVALSGFLVNYTPWGIRLYPLLISVTIFILAGSSITWVRRRRLAEVDRPYISFTISLHNWRGQSRANRVLSVVLIAAIMGMLGTIGYAVATPKEEDRFTEFYILGPEGMAEEYPEELMVGETATLVVGIINYESVAENYRVEVIIDGNRHDKINDIVLEQGETWEQEVVITPVEAREGQKVEFVLYRNGEPYRQLLLWVNVKELE